MIEESADFIPIWMVLSAAFGFLIGEAFGDRPVIASVSNKRMKIFAINSKTFTLACRQSKAHSINSAASSMTSTSASSL